MKTNLELKIIKSIYTHNNLIWEGRNKESLLLQIIIISIIGIRVIIVTIPRTLTYIIHLIIIKIGITIKYFQTFLLSNE